MSSSNILFPQNIEPDRKFYKSFPLKLSHSGYILISREICDFQKGSVPDTGRYNDIKLKILRFSRKGVGCGEGKNLFSREKKDNGADVR
ncbi:MAG: hypothetical protein IKC65_02455, partial [Lentisphaeria bacterium]|nr:hypothetical protein [Lentisphaeria bacterium]